MALGCVLADCMADVDGESDTTNTTAEARLAEDLAREESKARKRVEEEKARDEQPEQSVENPTDTSETTRDSKGKSAGEGGKEKVGKSDLSQKPTPKAKKSTPTTPEQAAKEALWKFQAAISPTEGKRRVA